MAQVKVEPLPLKQVLGIVPPLHNQSCSSRSSRPCRIRPRTPWAKDIMQPLITRDPTKCRTALHQFARRERELFDTQSTTSKLSFYLLLHRIIHYPYCNRNSSYALFSRVIDNNTVRSNSKATSYIYCYSNFSRIVPVAQGKFGVEAQELITGIQRYLSKPIPYIVPIGPLNLDNACC